MNSAAVREAMADRFRALRHRDFRLFWSGQLVSLVGTWMQSVAQGWLMHRLTASAMMLGLLGFCQFLPVTLFSLWAGVIVDRVDRRRMLLITQSCALVQAVALAALTSTGHIQPWMVLALAFAFGVFNAFDLPARQSVLVDLVDGDRHDLTNAIALNSAAFNTARIIGPAFAGVLLATVGEAGCFWLNALSYVAVLIALYAIRARGKPPVTEHPLEALRSGARYAWNTRPIRNLLVLLAVTAGLGFQYMTLLPIYARTILARGAETFGLLVAAFGVGALIAAVMMTRKLDRWALRRNLLIGLGASGLGLGVFAWSRSVPLSLAMGLLAGFGLILYVASTNILLQLTIDDSFRGRVMSYYTFMFVGTAPFGALWAGAVAQRFGAPIATSFCALILLGGAWWIARRLRFLRAEEAARAAGDAQTAPATTPE
jgi:MFS family permease